MLERLITRVENYLKYNTYSSVVSLSNKERKKLGKFCLNYCIENVGTHRSKGNPSVIIVNKKKSYYGEYCNSSQKIYVYYSECETIGKFINTFIHEYTHHTQNLKSYNKILSKLGYNDHPMEIEANGMAQKYTQQLIESFRKSLNK